MATSIPQGYHSITPQLEFKDARKAIEFYQKAFGAEQLSLHEGPDGRVLDAEIRIGDSVLMLGDEGPGSPAKSAESRHGSPVGFYLYVDDCDKVFTRALRAGASVIDMVEDRFWGDREGRVSDPFGYRWAIATHKKDVSEEEVQNVIEETARAAA